MALTYRSKALTPPPTQGDTLPKTVQFYLDNGAPEGGRNRVLFAAACQLRDIGVPLADCVSILSPRATLDGLPEGEITHCLTSVYAASKREAPKGSTGATYTPSGRQAPAKQAARSTVKPVVNSRAVPPPTPIEDGFAKLLGAAFLEGEGVCISPARMAEDGSVNPDRGVTLTREQWLEKLSAKGTVDRMFSTRLGLFVRVNPMDKKGQGRNEDVTAFRHVLVEFDKDEAGGTIPKDKQFGAILASGLPVTVVLDSGNKSIHAWVRVDAVDYDQYRERVEVVWQIFGEAYLDKANRNPSRLSRCPDGWRTVNGEHCKQSLLAVGLGADSWGAWEKTRSAHELGEPVRFGYLLDYDTSFDKNNVIGDRWMCKGGSLVIVGQSGVGKSSLNMQLAVGWALARDQMTFGIKPIKPLKSLILQAENDDGDLAEAAQGVARAFSLTAEERATADSNLLWHRITTLTGDEFLTTVEALVQLQRPDICWIDPLISFIGDDLSDQSVISHFCSEGLSSISLRTGVIFAIVHHTGKPPKDKSLSDSYTASDLAYSGLGSSALVNWAREVMVLTRLKVQDGEPPTFSLTFCKRRKRAGVRDFETNERTDQIVIKHSSDGTIRWEQSEKPTEPEKPSRGRAAQPRGSREAGESLPRVSAPPPRTYSLRKTPTTPPPTPAPPAPSGRPAALSDDAQAAIIAELVKGGGRPLDTATRNALASQFSVNPSTIWRFCSKWASDQDS